MSNRDATAGWEWRVAMHDYSIEDDNHRACPHNGEIWVLDDIPGPSLCVCSLCGAVLEPKSGTHSSATNETEYHQWDAVTPPQPVTGAP